MGLEPKSSVYASDAEPTNVYLLMRRRLQTMFGTGPVHFRPLSKTLPLAVLLGVFWSNVAAGQSFSPYSVFQSMSLTDLATLQVKLTYVGPQREVHQTVLFAASPSVFNLSLFLPFRRPGISYSNDNASVLSFTASTTELKAVIDNVGLLPNVTAGGVSSSPYLSFALLNTAGGTKAFEAILDLTDAASLFTQIRLALAQNTSGGLRLVSDQACSM